MSVRKEMNELLRVLDNAGITVIIGNTHYKLFASAGHSVSIGKSPSDRRAFANIRRDIRHAFNIDIRDYGWTK